MAEYVVERRLERGAIFLKECLLHCQGTKHTMAPNQVNPMMETDVSGYYTLKSQFIN